MIARQIEFCEGYKSNYLRNLKTLTEFGNRKLGIALAETVLGNDCMHWLGLGSRYKRKGGHIIVQRGN